MVWEMPETTDLFPVSWETLPCQQSYTHFFLGSETEVLAKLWELDGEVRREEQHEAELVGWDAEWGRAREGAEAAAEAACTGLRDERATGSSYGSQAASRNNMNNRSDRLKSNLNG